MSGSQAPTWYIETSAGLSGPYTTEQVREFLRAGRIGPETRISPKVSGGEWTLARQLIYFQAPPRPAEGAQTQAAAADSFFQAAQEEDPATSLFESLRAVKERRPGPQKHAPAPASGPDSGVGPSWTSASSADSSSQFKLWIGAALAIVGGIVLVTWIGSSGKNTDKGQEKAQDGPAASRGAARLELAPPSPRSITHASAPKPRVDLRSKGYSYSRPAAPPPAQAPPPAAAVRTNTKYARQPANPYANAVGGFHRTLPQQEEAQPIDETPETRRDEGSAPETNGATNELPPDAPGGQAQPQDADVAVPGEAPQPSQQ